MVEPIYELIYNLRKLGISVQRIDELTGENPRHWLENVYSSILREATDDELLQMTEWQKRTYEHGTLFLYKTPSGEITSGHGNHWIMPRGSVKLLRPEGFSNNKDIFIMTSELLKQFGIQRDLIKLYVYE